MSFEIKLQTNSSEKNKLDKTLTDILTLNGTLRNESSILNPTIRIEGDVSQVINCNYMTIPTFGRSYFITDITSLRNNIFEVSGPGDVLSTYKAGIRSNVGIIFRQENVYNLYLDDGVLKVYNNPQIVTKEFPGGFSGYEYILAIAGD